MNLAQPLRLAVVALASAALACGGGSSPVTGYAVVLPAGTTTRVNSGDAVRLALAAVHADGTFGPLPEGATVAWSSNVTSVAALSATGAAGASPIPAFGADVTAVFISNPSRTDRVNDLDDVLFFLDPGTAAQPTLVATANIAGVTPTGTATLTFNVGPALVGDATRGATLYGATQANCAFCHGNTGAGSPPNQDGTFSYNNSTYAYPAPGLNAAAGNLAGDPSWNAALLAMSARADVDNAGVELRSPMPDFLSEKVSGAVLTTQQYADIYAFLQTQTQ